MSITNSQAIAVAEIKPKLSKSNTLEGNITIAMENTHDHWLLGQAVNDRMEFETAMLIVSDFYGIDSPEFERIKIEMVMVNALFFTPSNVPIDFNQLLEQLPKDHEKIGIMELWKKVVKK